MLQGFAQLGIALLDLLEQSHVLDGDDRLISERLEQLDVFLREGADFRAAYRNSPDRNILTQ